MNFLKNKISYKSAFALLLIIVFVSIGTIYLLLSARDNNSTGGSVQTPSESALAQEATGSGKTTTDESSDTSKSSKESSPNSDIIKELDKENPTITLPVNGNTVTITGSGFSPSTITISAGETVKWVNNDSKNSWPASDPHPQHTDYSGFDSLGISAGSSWSFKFNNKGTWDYHDHNKPSKTGVVIVQ